MYTLIGGQRAEKFENHWLSSNRSSLTWLFWLLTSLLHFGSSIFWLIKIIEIFLQMEMKWFSHAFHKCSTHEKLWMAKFSVAPAIVVGTFLFTS